MRDSTKANSTNQSLIFENYTKELNELRKQYDQHPEVMRYAYENMRLKEKLQRVQLTFPDSEQKIAEFESMLNYQKALSNKILELESQASSAEYALPKDSKSDASVECSDVSESTNRVIVELIFRSSNCTESSVLLRPSA